MEIVKHNTENQKSALFHFHPKAEREQTNIQATICLGKGDFGKTRKSSMKVVDVPIEIRTRHFPNVRQKRYRWGQLAGSVAAEL
jgi:hypothetical protein